MTQDTNKLRVFRAERRMTQRKLSRKARINPTRISFIENGHVDPTDEERNRLAKVFGVPVSDLFPPTQSTAAVATS